VSYVYRYGAFGRDVCDCAHNLKSTAGIRFLLGGYIEFTFTIARQGSRSFFAGFKGHELFCHG